MIGKKLINTGAAGGADAFKPSNHFNTVLYTGNGSSQRIGGYINRGAVFNGSSSKITLPNNTGGIGETNSSFSFWVYPVSVSSGYQIVALLTNNDWIEIRYNSSGQFQIFPARQSNSTYVSLSAVTKAANNWYNIVITRDSATSTIKLYIDGSLVETNTSWDGTLTSSSDPNGLGANVAANSLHFGGKLDQVRIFDKALSSTEVTTLYGETHASTTIETTDIFNDNSGVALYQLDGNANDTGGVNGKFGSAAIFNGSSSKIDIPGVLTGITNNFSYSFWANPSTASSNNYIAIAANISSNTNRVLFNANNGGNYYFDFGNITSGGRIFGTSPSSWFDGNWHHFVIIKTSTSQLIFVDGQELRNVSGQTSSISGLSNIAIGNYTSNYSNGSIDQVRIYDTALSSTDVSNLYNETSVPTTNLLAHYKLDGDARDEQQLYDGTATNVTYAYDGTASNVTYQEATNFSPDLVWIKERNGTYHHRLQDSVRGAGYRIYSSATNAEGYSSSSITSFDSNGFTVGSNAGVNFANHTYAAWCFNAGEDTPVTNNDGTIASTVKANQEAGFSIVKYNGTGTAQTIGHGLSSAPELIITKGLNSATNWATYSATLGATKYLVLDGTNAAINTSAAAWNNTAPTSSVFSVGSGFSYSSGIAYNFHSVDGYQKIGSYTGNGSTNGTMVETGFEPAFVMVKATNLDRNWVILDNKRGYGNNLSANTSLAEYLTSNGQGMEVQFLSNGFQIETSSSWINNNTTNYIYLAIAADPDTTTPTVENSFDVVTYDGRSTTGTVDVATDFKPDLVWIKCRGTGHHHYIVDSVRGANKVLSSNLTSSDPAFTPDEFTSFNEDGFTVNFTSGGGRTAYSSDGPYVAWCWKAGDHDDNLPQINTEGTIDSIVSVNDAAGFSIVSWTSSGSVATVGHGLSQAPEIIITKNRGNTGAWSVYSSELGNTKRLRLNENFAEETNTVWGNTSPTNSVFTQDVTGGTTEVIAYCFTSIAGYQKIGTYNGGSSGSSNVIATGFKPRFLLVKRTDAAGDAWQMFDSIRGGGDTFDNYVQANESAAETSYSLREVNFASNGFYWTNAESGTNISGGTYIYLAIK